MALVWKALDTRCPITYNKQNEPVTKWDFKTLRAKVPGGWLVFNRSRLASSSFTGLTFYPDPEHIWDGSSLDEDESRLMHEVVEGQTFAISDVEYCARFSYSSDLTTYYVLHFGMDVKNKSKKPCGFNPENTFLEDSKGNIYSCREPTGSVEDLQPDSASDAFCCFEIHGNINEITPFYWCHKAGIFRIKFQIDENRILKE